MSFQVGAACYSDLVGAAGAACSSFTPQITGVPSSSGKVSTVSCAGVTADGKLQMRTSIDSPGAAAGPGGGNGMWTIQPGSSSGAGFSGDYGQDLCQGAAGCVQTDACNGTSGTAPDHFVWKQEACSLPGAADPPVVYVTEVAPAFGDCLWGQFVDAALGIFSALLVAWVLIWSVLAVRRALNWGRGES